MWSALNLDNLSKQASNLVQQATEKSGELISQASQVAQDSLRKISNDDDNNEVANENPMQSPMPLNPNETCPTSDGQAEHSETTLKIAEKADQIADNLFNFASKFADNAYTNLSHAAAQAQETANLAHEIAVESAGKLQENELIGGLVKTIESKTFIGDFNGLQQGFIGDNNEKSNKQAAYPWENYDNAEELKEKILAISTEKRNFLRNPPAGVRFKFDYHESFPTALKIIEVDPNLSKMRFEMVPKKLTEEVFWRNYFYRMSLVTQSSTLKQLSKSQENLAKIDVEASQVEDLPGNTRKRNDESVNISEDGEFISQENAEINADDLQKEMEALGMDNNDDWEKELAAELDEYEVVDGAGDQKPDNGKDSSEWEKELNDMLNDA